MSRELPQIAIPAPPEYLSGDSPAISLIDLVDRVLLRHSFPPKIEEEETPDAKEATR